jgi:DNA polymerase-1
VSIIYLDIETDNSPGFNGLDVFGGRIVTIQLLMPNGKTRILKDPNQAQMDGIKPILENNLIIGHNLKFDCKFIKQKFGVTLRNVYDTYIAEIVISGGVYANSKYCRINKIGLRLKDLVQRYLGKHMDKGEQKGFMYGVPLTPQQIEYAALDLQYLPEIVKQQKAKIKVQGLERTIDIEMKCLPAMVWLELSGFRMDLDKVAAVEKKLNLVVKATEKYLLPRMSPHLKTPINFNSSTQIINVLTRMGYDIPLKRNSKGIMAKSVDEDSLNKFKGDKLIQMYIRYKRAMKFLTSYIYPTRDKITGKKVKKVIRSCIYTDGRSYTNFNQYGTETGRLSGRTNDVKKLPIQSMNFQTQPKSLHWRDVFIPDVGHQLIVSDYSQVEPRIMAQVSSDPKMIAAYREGKDLYKLTAEAIFNIPYDQIKKKSKERDIAKAITLGLCYGLRTPGLIKKLKTESNITISEDEARQYIRKFQRTYPVVTRFLAQTGNNAVKEKKVRNICGRIRDFPNVRPGEEWHIKNAAMNAVIQSLSADITKIAMGNLFLILEPMGVRFCSTVHDEIVVEAPEEISGKVRDIVEEEMIKAGEIFLKNVPCTIECNIHTEWKK